MKKLIVWLVLFVGMLLLAGLFWWSRKLPVPLQRILPSPPIGEIGDTTGAITQSLDAIDLGNLDEVFKTIDQNMNAL